MLGQAGKVDLSRSDAVFPDKEAAEWCNGLWLEDYVHAVLSKLFNNGAIDDWSKSFEFSSEPQDKKDPTGRQAAKGYKNEFDAAFSKNGKLYVLECKTISTKGAEDAGSGKNREVTNITYKLDALVTKAGGSFAKGILVSVNPIPVNEQKRLQEARHKVITGRNIITLENEISTIINS